MEFLSRPVAELELVVSSRIRCASRPKEEARSSEAHKRRKQAWSRQRGQNIPVNRRMWVGCGGRAEPVSKRRRYSGCTDNRNQGVVALAAIALNAGICPRMKDWAKKKNEALKQFGMLEPPPR